MVSALKLMELTDMHALGEIYADPYVAKVGHDHRAAEPIVHPAAKYFGAYIDGELCGAFLVIDSGFIEVDVHALLRRSALRESRQLGRMCIDKIFENTEIHRVTAYVIQGLKTAYNYCIRLGFVDEGMRRNACMKGGKLLGVHVLGLTRSDWER